MNKNFISSARQRLFLLPEGQLRRVNLTKAARTLFGVALSTTCISGCGGGGGSQSGSPSGRGVDSQSSLVFESNRDGDFEILRMNQDGTNVTRVTDNNVNDTQPSVSKDGQRVVFLSNRSGSNEIFVIDAQGTRQLTRNTFDDKQPDLSPDGRMVVFLSTRNDTSDLFLVDVISRKETQLTSSFDLEQNPTWTTDGRILFSSNAESEFFQIYEIDTSGKNLQPLLDADDSNQITPSASPDNKHVAFVAQRDDDSDIFLFNRVTKTTTQLTENGSNNNKPVFSPDGQHIFFSSKRSGNDDIYSMNLDGANVQNLTRNPAIDRSPDTR